MNVPLDLNKGIIANIDENNICGPEIIKNGEFITYSAKNYNNYSTNFYNNIEDFYNKVMEYYKNDNIIDSRITDFCRIIILFQNSSPKTYYYRIITGWDKENNKPILQETAQKQDDPHGGLISRVRVDNYEEMIDLPQNYSIQGATFFDFQMTYMNNIFVVLLFNNNNPTPFLAQIVRCYNGRFVSYDPNTGQRFGYCDDSSAISLLNMNTIIKLSKVLMTAACAQNYSNNWCGALITGRIDIGNLGYQTYFFTGQTIYDQLIYRNFGIGFNYYPQAQYAYAFKLNKLTLNLSTRADLMFFVDNTVIYVFYVLPLGINAIRFTNLQNHPGGTMEYHNKIPKIGINNQSSQYSDALLLCSENNNVITDEIEPVQICFNREYAPSNFTNNSQTFPQQSTNTYSLENPSISYFYAAPSKIYYSNYIYQPNSTIKSMTLTGRITNIQGIGLGTMTTQKWDNIINQYNGVTVGTYDKSISQVQFTYDQRTTTSIGHLSQADICLTYQGCLLENSIGKLGVGYFYENNSIPAIQTKENKFDDYDVYIVKDLNQEYLLPNNLKNPLFDTKRRYISRLRSGFYYFTNICLPFYFVETEEKILDFLYDQSNMSYNLFPYGSTQLSEIRYAVNPTALFNLDLNNLMLYSFRPAINPRLLNVNKMTGNVWLAGGDYILLFNGEEFYDISRATRNNLLFYSKDISGPVLCQSNNSKYKGVAYDENLPGNQAINIFMEFSDNISYNSSATFDKESYIMSEFNSQIYGSTNVGNVIQNKGDLATLYSVRYFVSDSDYFRDTGSGTNLIQQIKRINSKVGLDYIAYSDKFMFLYSRFDDTLYIIDGSMEKQKFLNFSRWHDSLLLNGIYDSFSDFLYLLFDNPDDTVSIIMIDSDRNINEIKEDFRGNIFLKSFQTNRGTTFMISNQYNEIKILNYSIKSNPILGCESILKPYYFKTILFGGESAFEEAALTGIKFRVVEWPPYYDLSLSFKGTAKRETSLMSEIKDITIKKEMFQKSNGQYSSHIEFKDVVGAGLMLELYSKQKVLLSNIEMIIEPNKGSSYSEKLIDNNSY